MAPLATSLASNPERLEEAVTNKTKTQLAFIIQVRCSAAVLYFIPSFHRFTTLSGITVMVQRKLGIDLKTAAQSLT